MYAGMVLFIEFFGTINGNPLDHGYVNYADLTLFISCWYAKLNYINVYIVYQDY